MTVDFMSQIQLLNGIEIAGYSGAYCTNKTVTLELHVQLPIDFPINAQTDIMTLPPSFRTRAAYFPTVAQYTDEWRLSPSRLCYGYLSPSGIFKVSVPDKNTTWINISAIYFRKV
ncbi:MAG: hypothetical protein [Bacteriophage sp.]|nr:MAG: hypothetical protein [Bacteriophage sp.]